MDRRTPQALLLGIILVMLWFTVFYPIFYPRPVTPPGPTPPVPPSKTDTPVTPPENPDVPVPPPPTTTLPDLPAQTVPARFGNLHLAFDNRGARLVQAKLQDAELDLVPLTPPGDTIPLGLFVLRSPAGDESLERRGWTLVSGDDRGVIFETQTSGGLTIRKHFLPGATPDTLRVMLELVNPADAAHTFDGTLDVFPGIEHDGRYRHQLYHHALLAEGPQGRPVAPEKFTSWVKKGGGQTTLGIQRYQMSLTDEDMEGKVTLKGSQAAYAGIFNRYFALAIWAQSPIDQTRWKDVILRPVERSSRNLANEQPELRVNTNMELDLAAIPVAPSGRETLTLEAYLGPLQSGRLPPELGDADTVIDFRGFDFIAKILLWLMSLFRDVNWGLGIIVMTIVVRLCLSPLSIFSQASMLKVSKVMQRMKPKMEAIQRRYKDDPQRLQKEMGEMWREEGFSPFSQMRGCLPVFFQLPIFICMYAVLDQAVELRQQPFILWITDLSQPDRLVAFGRNFSFGFCGLEIFSADGINVLPVVMAATTTFQMFMTPIAATDPQQAQTQKMMRWMIPTMFFLFCYSLPSGLSLYFWVNSLLAILESKIVKTYIVKPDDPSAGGPEVGAVK